MFNFLFSYSLYAKNSDQPVKTDKNEDNLNAEFWHK